LDVFGCFSVPYCAVLYDFYIFGIVTLRSFT